MPSWGRRCVRPRVSSSSLLLVKDRRAEPVGRRRPRQRRQTADSPVISSSRLLAQVALGSSGLQRLPRRTHRGRSQRVEEALAPRHRSDRRPPSRRRTAWTPRRSDVSIAAYRLGEVRLGIRSWRSARSVVIVSSDASRSAIAPLPGSEVWMPMQRRRRRSSPARGRLHTAEACRRHRTPQPRAREHTARPAPLTVQRPETSQVVCHEVFLSSRGLP